MLKDNRWVFMIASSVAVILMIALLVFYRKKINIFVSVSLALVIGGGIGNMIDRVAYGYVVDFINFELIDFAVFNAADSFVCVGVFLIFIYILFIDDGGLLSNLKRKPAVQVDDMTANVEGSKISHGADVSINKDGMRHECAESDCLSDSRKDNRVNKVQHHGSRALRNMRKSVLSSETDGSVDRDDY